MSLNDLGAVVVSEANATHVTSVAGLVTRQFPAPSTSPDGRYVVLGDGTILAVDSGDLVVQRTPLLLSNQDMVPPSPFADHNHALVVLTEGTFADPTADAVSAVEWTTGAVTKLGVADHATGDPQALGAFVSVPAPQGPSGSYSTGDVSVELRDVGKAPTVIATAKTLAKLVDQAPQTPVALWPFADPHGDKVAIGVGPVAGGALTGIVVVDRSGQPDRHDARCRHRRSDMGPGGQSLVYPSGRQVMIWTPGAGTPTDSEIANPTDDYGTCIWSQAGTWLLCPYGQSGLPQHWDLLAYPHGQPTITATAPGNPIIWMPPPTPTDATSP